MSEPPTGTPPPPPPPPVPSSSSTEKTDTGSTKLGFLPQGSRSPTSQHPPRPTGALNRKVSFNHEQMKKPGPTREESYATLDGERIAMEESDVAADNGTFHASNRSPLFTNTKSPMLTSVTYQHDRSSSLDAFSLGMDSASPTPGASRTTSVDIKAVNPLESEAEMLILKALDRKDQEQGLAMTNVSLLGNIPDKSAAVFRPAADGPTVPNLSSGAVALERPIHQRGVTTESRLADLSDALAGLRNDIINTEGVPIPTGLTNEKQDNVVHANGPSAATLAKTVSILHRGRLRSENSVRREDLREIKTKFSQDDGSTSTGGRSTLSRLRMAMSTPKGIGTGTNHLDVPPNDTIETPDSDGHKKTDSDVKLPDVEVGGCGGAPAPDARGASQDVSDSAHGFEGFGGTGKKRKKRNHLAMIDKAQPGVVRDFQIFCGQRRTGFVLYLRFLILVIVPSVAVAFILYYAAGNPPYGKIVKRPVIGNNTVILLNEDDERVNENDTSYSWWILFIGVRQALIFSLAQLIQVFLIDFLCLSTRFFVQVFGNLVTLLIVQSKGWPFLCLWWGSLSFALLYGNRAFSNHWLYFQSGLGIFNENNPGGAATVSMWYTRVLVISILVSVLVSFKRLVVGLYLGKKTYCNYAEDLTQTVKKVLLLSEIAGLARQCLVESMNQNDEITRPLSISQRFNSVQLRGLITTETPSPDEEDKGNSGSRQVSTEGQNLLQASDRSKIRDLLGDWEDPDLDNQYQDASVTISSILQFRQSLSLLNTAFIFSIAWGDVSTRESMVVSSEEVYRQLMFRSPDPNVLTFDVLALLCKCRGQMDQAKLKELIRLLRPDRDGNLTLLDFVKSVDSVYKEVKLLRATIMNSEKIDLALERFINILFYVLTTCTIVSQLGYNPLTLFISLSSIILAFAFMIGSAASKMCEGWLFILIRRPYGIGDRINIAGPDAPSDPDGSATWIVKDVTLFHTVAVYGNTNEQATISNGSLASSRVINMARSPNPLIHVNLNFSIDTPHEKIALFEQTAREFVKSRPREWRSFESFRVKKIVVEGAVVEYKMLLKHRDSWQNIGVVLQSKADVTSFCLELTKKLDMRYHSPPLPVELNVTTHDRREADGSGKSQSDSTGQKVLADFTSFLRAG